MFIIYLYIYYTTKIKEIINKILYRNYIGISIGNNCKAARYGKSNGLRKSKRRL